MTAGAGPVTRYIKGTPEFEEMIKKITPVEKVHRQSLERTRIFAEPQDTYRTALRRRENIHKI